MFKKACKEARLAIREVKKNWFQQKAEEATCFGENEGKWSGGVLEISGREEEDWSL